MGRLTNRARRFRYGRARVVLWGGRRYDIQVGSERDLRRCAMLNAFRYRLYFAFRNPILERARGV